MEKGLSSQEGNPLHFRDGLKQENVKQENIKPQNLEATNFERVKTLKESVGLEAHNDASLVKKLKQVWPFGESKTIFAPAFEERHGLQAELAQR